MEVKKQIRQKKRKGSDIKDDEGERKRFKELLKEPVKVEDTLDRQQARVQRENELAKTRGVIYIGHIPHGFYEEELRKYFSQFGEVTRLRVSRSRKTGGSRGYAFVEFAHDAVAQIAAETMNGYLMFDRLLQCKVVPKEKVHPKMFGLRFPFPLTREITRTFINMERTEDREKKNKKLRVRRLKKQMNKLKNNGINLNVPLVGKPETQANSSKATPAKVKDVKKTKKSVKPGKRATQSIGNTADDSQHSFVVDTDDDEITFKTPPNAKKVKKLKTSKGRKTIA